MLYKVTKQYARGTDVPVAEFNDINDAKIFVFARLAEDAKLKVKVTYRLFEGIEMLEEFSESPASASGGVSQTSGSSAGQKSSFQPTPFNAAPRPPGMPHNWIKDDEEKSKK